MRYSDLKCFSYIDKKRKTNKISQEVAILPCSESQPKNNNSPYIENGKFKKMKLNTESVANVPSKLEVNQKSKEKQLMNAVLITLSSPNKQFQNARVFLG